MLDHGPLQQLLAAVPVALLELDDAGVDETLDVIRPGLQQTVEVFQRAFQLAFLEVRFAQEPGQFVVAAVEAGRRLQRFHRAGQVQPVQRVLRFLQELREGGAPAALVEPQYAVLDRRETFALLQHQELVVHLGLPEVAPLGGVDHVLPFQDVAQGQHAGVMDEDALLLPLHGAQDLLHRLAGALENLLEDRDPFQQVLVEGELLVAGVERLLARDGGAGEHHQLLPAALAVLRVVLVPRAADLAVHRGGEPTC